jgi:hypothetical protein
MVPHTRNMLQIRRVSLCETKLKFSLFLTIFDETSYYMIIYYKMSSFGINYVVSWFVHFSKLCPEFDAFCRLGYLS